MKARLAGARIAVRDTRYRRRVGSSKIAGTWRGSALAVRDISWCLLRLRLFGFAWPDRGAVGARSARRSSVDGQPRVRVPLRASTRVQPQRPPRLERPTATSSRHMMM